MLEQDFHRTIDQAASHVTDATCAARAAAAGRVPHQHRRWVNRAISNLERAQDDLYKARNDPFSCPPPRKPRQLELL